MEIGYVISITGRTFFLTRLTVDKSGKYCLAVATFHAFQASFWTAIIPRLCYSGFSFAQPFLIHTIVNSIGTPTPDHPQGVVGSLIGATALIYLGIAVRFLVPKSSLC